MPRSRQSSHLFIGTNRARLAGRGIGPFRLDGRPASDSLQAVSSDVIIVTGPPGAGKSTTARALAATYPRSVHLHTDDFWHCIVSGAIPPHLPESNDQNQTVMNVIRQAAFTYAAGGFTTIVDGIIGPWMLDRFRGSGRSDVPRRHYIVLRLARDEILRRAQERTTPDALVDEGPVGSLWDQFADLGLLEPHAIDTTDQEPAETLIAVREAIASHRFLFDEET